MTNLFSSTCLFLPIPFTQKIHQQHDKNEYVNANSLHETQRVIPHNDGIFYID